jgi:hypothetical protein
LSDDRVGRGILPDARILFVRGQEVDERFELYSVLPASGARPAKLSGVLPAAGDVAFGFAPTPDGTRVVFAADRDVDGSLQLFVSPVDGSAAPLELSPAFGAGESKGVDATGAPLVWVTGDSARVLFVLDGSGEQLLGVPLDGSSPAVPVSALAPPSDGLPLERGAVQFTRDGRSAVYRAASRSLAVSSSSPLPSRVAPACGSRPRRAPRRTSRPASSC